MGDIFGGITCVGVTGNLSIPLSGLIRFIATSVPVGQGWIGSDYQLQLVPRAGPANGRKEMFRVDSEGLCYVREASNSMAGVATLGVGGTVTVLNTEVTSSNRFNLTVQDGGPAPTGTVFIQSRNPGVSFTIASSAGAGDAGVIVYYQLWKATAP